jgi:hypothetical protein
MVAVNHPALGSTSWFTPVDQNWTNLQNALNNGQGVTIANSTPTQLSANQNDYAFAGGNSAYVFQRLSASAAVNVTGITAGSDGQRYVLANVGTNNITITNQDTNSQAANRVITGSGASVILAPDQLMDLVYDGTTSRWRVESIRTSGGGGGGSLIKQVIYSSGSGTYTPSANATKIVVIAIGGGGGGGGAISTTGSGGAAGGGASGGVVQKYISSLAASYSYAVGAAGAGGASNGGDGGSGGDATFGTSLITAKGGGGGTGVDDNGGQGGAQQAGTTGGDINNPGAPGMYGSIVIGQTTNLFGGTGGSTVYGGGGSGGASGNAMGGGGGGAATTSGSGAGGGAGAAGGIIIYEYA